MTRLTAGQIANKAADLVEGDRAQAYGDRSASFANVARLWNAWLRNNKSDVTYDLLDPMDVAVLMALLKIGRMASGSFQIDNFIDSAGYISLAGELAAPDQTRR